MLLNTKTVAPLRFLTKSFDGNFVFAMSDLLFFREYGSYFSKKFFFYRRHFSGNINILSKAFCKASEKASDRLISLVRDIADNDIDDFSVSGCFIVGDFVHMLYHTFGKGSQDVSIAYFCFGKNGNPLVIYIDDVKVDKGRFGWVSNIIANHYKISSQNEIERFALSQAGIVIVYDMFKKFADVETKFIAKGRRLKIDKEKFKNDLPFNVTYLTSTWFTNIVRSAGFKVSGHFRLQPCGEGLKDRKIIWINEFQKSGYSRKAQIVKNKD